VAIHKSHEKGVKVERFSIAANMLSRGTYKKVNGQKIKFSGRWSLFDNMDIRLDGNTEHLLLSPRQRVGNPQTDTPVQLNECRH
jgi:hypothetical protein